MNGDDKKYATAKIFRAWYTQSYIDEGCDILNTNINSIQTALRELINRMFPFEGDSLSFFNRQQNAIWTEMQ